jgi:hypothetical protein
MATSLKCANSISEELCSFGRAWGLLRFADSWSRPMSNAWAPAPRLKGSSRSRDERSMASSPVSHRWLCIGTELPHLTRLSRRGGVSLQHRPPRADDLEIGERAAT